MQAKIAVIGTLRISPQQVRKVIPHLRTLIEASRLHEGCIAYDVAEDCFEPGVIRVSEIWNDRECLESHISHPDVQPWHAALRSFDVLESRYVVLEVSGANVI
ncbi:Quinol monooxygenase YgiN [Caballeronia arationis]|uniref:Quinol monooxygenase YgiN n=1 Tax=Caballeronia arationis TaxID=1777142 RepID=A0A7Z7I218_9BURK|nr:Quinol monooxygenase YgiN [Caballeronia arationis]